ncbi:hypothetical protein B0681_02060 [Moraxella porci DSM 25326]|uniref:Uncharacterized protein n=1 Tax=Moraxella porci DSM 25326 TaxID=573983 RepID=A0A1T0CWH8_9GAMM|nr:hypothetical protein B0681_02060 [Moraxella porci DSM 25326]
MGTPSAVVSSQNGHVLYIRLCVKLTSRFINLIKFKNTKIDERDGSDLHLIQKPTTIKSQSSSADDG